MTKYIKLLLFLTIISNGKEGITMQDIKDVSMIQLIANSEKYDGKFIRVIGFTKVGFEINTIYPSSLDAEHAVLINGLFLSLDKKEMSKYSINNKKYSIIEGFFNVKKRGRGNIRLGTIEKITRFEIWGEK
jgi:hypothetical protein